MNDDIDLDMAGLFPHTAADHNDVLRARLLAQTMNDQVRMTGVLPRSTPKEQELARNVFEGRNKLPYNPSSGTLAHLGMMISQYDREVVKDAASIRNYVTNTLLELSLDDDKKVKLRALELLGKITDVALFSERREINITSDDSEMVSALKERLRRLRPVDITDVVEVPSDAERAERTDDKRDSDPAG